VVIGAWPAEPDLAASGNLDDLPAYAQEPLTGAMPEKAAALDPGVFLAAAQRALVKEVIA
jgi:dethiobiotin synthetase